MSALPRLGSVMGSRVGWIRVRDTATGTVEELPPETLCSAYGAVQSVADVAPSTPVLVREGRESWAGVVLEAVR